MSDSDDDWSSDDDDEVIVIDADYIHRALTEHAGKPGRQFVDIMFELMRVSKVAGLRFVIDNAICIARETTFVYAMVVLLVHDEWSRDDVVHQLTLLGNFFVYAVLFVICITYVGFGVWYRRKYGL